MGGFSDEKHPLTTAPSDQLKPLLLFSSLPSRMKQLVFSDAGALSVSGVSWQ